MSRLWDKGNEVNQLALRFTVGDDHEIDSQLIRMDVIGTRAHARCLEASGLINRAELAQIESALDGIDERAKRGELRVSIEQEDSHTLLESELAASLGPVGLKIHAGRSRNDQAATMVRLAMREWLADAAESVGGVVEALCSVAERYADVPMPGYTHMQRAMPSSVAAWALGYAEALCERGEMLLGLRRHLSRSPLGSAAGYGVPMRLARDVAARAMGFEHVQAVTSVQITRGVDELACCQSLQLVGIVVSRMAADLVLFATREYGFAKLPADLTTGSSIMPQKANPDLFELMRARGAAIGAHCAAISHVIAGLPGGYQRDLQLTKRHVALAFSETADVLAAARLAVARVEFDAAACARGMTPELYATAAAYRKVREGMPFRDAYRIAAADKASWKPGLAEPGADAADSPEYCQRLRDEVTRRVCGLSRTSDEGCA